MAAAVFISPIVGFALYFVGLVLGQLCLAAVVDHFAFLGLPRRPFTTLRGVSAALAVIGVVLAAAEAVGSAGSELGGVIGGMLVAVLAGAGLPVQSAINRSAAQALRGPEQGATLSFLVGLLASGIGSLVVGLLVEEPDVSGAMEEAPWWSWVGGSAGVFFVVSAIVLPGFISVSSMFLAIVTGQVFVSLLLDAMGAFSEAEVPSALRVIGCCVVLTAAFVGEYARMNAGASQGSCDNDASATTSTDKNGNSIHGGDVLRVNVDVDVDGDRIEGVGLNDGVGEDAEQVDADEFPRSPLLQHMSDTRAQQAGLVSPTEDLPEMCLANTESGEVGHEEIELVGRTDI